MVNLPTGDGYLPLHRFREPIRTSRVAQVRPYRRRQIAPINAAFAAGSLIISTLPATQAATLKTVRDPLGRFTINMPNMPATWNIQTSTSSRAAAVTAEAHTVSGQ